MNFLDVRTIMFSHLATDVIATLVIILLWRHSRKRFLGSFLWVVDFCFQTTAVILILLRHIIPDWASMVLGNTLVVAGAFLGYMGLERFIGRISRQVFNWLLLALFMAVHTYFTFIVPDLKWRTINLSIGIFIFCFQCSWLVFRRVPSGLRPIMRSVGLVFGFFSLVSIIRILVTIDIHYPDNEFFHSGLFDALMMMSYQLLLILLAYSLTLMVNHRLLTDIQSQEEKFSKVFHSSPYAVMLTRLTDGRINEVNDGFVNLTGYERDEVMGKTTIEMRLWARDQDRLIFVKAISEGGKIQGKEFLFRIKSGDLLTGLVSAEIIQINQEPFILSSINDISERKRMEEALRESEEKYRLIAESAEDWAYWISPEGELRYISPSCELLTGYSPAEFTGNNRLLLEIVHPEDRETVEKDLAKAQEETGPDELEYRIITKTGQTRWMRHFCRPVHNPKGQYTGRRSTNRNITDRKRAEKALHESEQKFSLAFRTSPYAIIIMRLKDGKVIELNEAFYSLSGYSHQEVAQKTLYDLSLWVNLEDRNRVMNMLQSGQRVIGQEFEFKKKDGQIGTGLFSCEVFLLKNEKFILSSISDITGRKKNEEALRESEERYRQVVENASEAILVAQDGMIKFHNPKATELSGYSEDELPDKPFIEYVHPEDRALVLERYQERLKGVTVPPVYSFRMIDKEGKTRWVEVNPVTISWKGKPATLILLEEITDRKEMEEQLKKMSIMDELTGLYNRRGFLTLAQQQLKVAERTKKEMLLFFADLDNMKWINDNLGHQQGDRALTDIAALLKETFRESDILSRIGGDEFAVLALDTPEINSEMLISRLKDSMKSFNQKRQRRFNLSLSIGLARYLPDTPVTIDHLLAEADRRMYEQKRNSNISKAN
jgi:diguanylate cyclase (GGDEF)-like protein/PAS domain S-box-containing protein